jgi:mRNA interferase YafQ
MRRIERTNRFKRDYKREAKGPNRLTLKNAFTEVLTILANDQVLAEKYRDHALVGEWTDHRDCHIKPDLVLIYRKSNAEVLQLVRLVPRHRDFDRFSEAARARGKARRAGNGRSPCQAAQRCPRARAASLNRSKSLWRGTRFAQ